MKATRLLKTTLAVTLLLSTTAVSMVSADELAVTYSTGQISDQPEPAYVPPPVYAPPVAVQTPVVMPAAPPQFVFVPEIGFYVATGVGFDLMFDGIAYYFHDRGHWFRTSYYGGSWEPIRRTILPELIVRYKIVDIRRHSAVEFKRFEHEGPRYRGKLHRPEIRREDRRGEHRDERKGERREERREEFRERR